MSRSDIFLYSEPYSPTGNVTSDGVLNQLGRPKLDMFTVLVREAVQNSWDARAVPNQTIRFGIAVWKIDKRQRDGLRLFFQDVPQGLALNAVMDSQEDILLMSIYDRGTMGLGGPTRADQRLEGDEAYDFVDFLRNVGQPPDKKLAGGTYGYGKAAFYRASRARTILVHTRCAWRGITESRFIGAALGEPYAENGRRFTGRHWWGRELDNIAEPLTGQRADQAAAFLHLPPYKEEERGTTITIVQPAFEDVEKTIITMRDALLWYFWPKMLLNQAHHPSIDFEMFWNHQTVSIPAPENFPPLDLFVKAASHLKTQDVGTKTLFGRVDEVASLKPKQSLGKLALEKGVAKPRQYGAVDGAPIPINERCHHVALMRQPELVVNYLPCEGLPVNSAEYAGVFITNPEVDRIFADSEPPTHDEWMPNYLEESRHKTFVKMAFKRISEFATEFVRPSPTKISAGGSALPLGAFANMMGQILPGRTADDGRYTKPRPTMTQQELVEIASASETAVSFLGDILNRPDGTVQPVLINANMPDMSSMPLPIDLSPATSTPSLQLPTDSISKGTSVDGSLPVNDETVKLNRGLIIARMYADSTFMLVDDKVPAVSFQLEITQKGQNAAARIWIAVQAVLEDGSFEDDPPQGVLLPKVLYWRKPDGSRTTAKPFAEVDENSLGIWEIVVNHIDDAIIGLDISVEQLT